MSTVQEFEQALARLSLPELDAVAKWIAQHVKELAASTGEDYAQSEYGISPEEMARFDERMKARNAQALEQGQATLFNGKFDPSCLD